MKQIDIGTCIPGDRALDWLPHMMKAGFECAALNFHMSTNGVEIEELAPKVLEVLGDSGVYISTIGFYCNALQYEEHQHILEHFIDSVHLFGTKMVSTFAGGLEGKSVEESIPVYRKVFGELARRAESKGVTLAVENCPMGGNWQRVTCNIAFHPKAWEMMFDAVPGDAIGLEWEPGHQMIQLIDPISQLRQWAKHIVHLHGKDASVDWEAVRRLGVFGVNDFAPQRTPGFGDTDWRQVFSILHEHGYQGDVCVEGYHDPIYHGDWEMTAQKHSLNYLKWCRGGEFIPNPWDQN